MSAITIKNGIGYQSGVRLPFVKSPNIGGKLTPEYIVIHDTASGLKDDRIGDRFDAFLTKNGKV